MRKAIYFLPPVEKTLHLLLHVYLSISKTKEKQIKKPLSLLAQVIFYLNIFICSQTYTTLVNVQLY